MLTTFERALGPVLSFQHIRMTCSRWTYKPRIYALADKKCYSRNLASTIRKEWRTQFILIRACKHIHFSLNEEHAYKRIWALMNLCYKNERLYSRRTQASKSHYVKTSNRSRSICNGPLTPITSTHTCNSCCLASVTYKRARMTPGLASTTPVTNVDFW
jgi:hypothetical protein